MSPKKTFSNWLVTKYLLVIRNEENFAEKTSFSFTYGRVLVSFLFMFFTVSIGSILLYDKWAKDILFPPENQFDLERSLIQLTSKVDSLETDVEQKNRFINSFKVYLGAEDVLKDTLLGEEDSLVQHVNLENNLSDQEIDSLFRLEFEASKEKVGIERVANREDVPQMFFFPPVEGVVSRRYDSRISHWGIDLVSKDNEPIKAVSDGTVVLSSWTEDSGYVIAIQHRNNLISVYKHNSELLKKVGNFVTEGDIIAIIGNTGELTTGPHLHFELWYNGNPVDPEDFIQFN